METGEEHVATQQRDPRTEAILGAAFEVHTTLGPGFEETIYQRALAREFAVRNLDAAREVWLDIRYKGEIVGRKRVDFLVEGIMLEIKAKSEFEPQDFVQAISYLKATGSTIGLLLNFGSAKLEYKRLIQSHSTQMQP